MAVLECIFADAEVAKALGLARLFLEVSGDAPDSLMVILKQSLGKHIKRRSCACHASLSCGCCSAPGCRPLPRCCVVHPCPAQLATALCRADGYRKTLDGELASIRRIYELKARAFAALWAVFAASLVGLFNFISTMLWSFYGDDITESLTG